MKWFCILLFNFVIFCGIHGLQSLERDRVSCYADPSRDAGFARDFPLCLEHSSGEEWGVAKRFFESIPATGPECQCCGDPSIFWGYLELFSNICPAFSYGIDFLFFQMKYAHRYKSCSCYWPERSRKAAEISDLAYGLFDDLVSNTALSCLLFDKEERKSLRCDELNKHGLLVSFIGCRFRFSDYCALCQAIETYAKYRFGGREMAEIQDKLDTIIETLYPEFLTLCTDCYLKHPNASVAKEICFMKYMVGDISGVDMLRIDPLEKGLDSMGEYSRESTEFGTSFGLDSVDTEEFSRPVEKWGASCYSHGNESYLTNFDPLAPVRLFQVAISYNDQLLYGRAITALSSAISEFSSWYSAPTCLREVRGNREDGYYVEAQRNAFAERALAYFETDQIALALQDYEAAKKLTIRPLCPLITPLRKGSGVYIPEHKIEFSRGLIAGTVAGAKVSVDEFFPSLLGCFRGILNGLWAFACAPDEVSEEFMVAAYSVGEFVFTHRADETIQYLIPEIKALALSWNILDDYGRGEKIGYIIGKYGVDVFSSGALVKGVNKVRALKRANTMLTMERCAASKANVATIQKESAKIAAAREKLLKEAAKNGSILVKNYNAKCHIMQKKHAWEKVIGLTGDIEEDFKKVIAFLEQNNISDKAFMVETRAFPLVGPELKTAIYEKKIGQSVVSATFETHLGTGETFLQDAWVVTR